MPKTWNESGIPLAYFITFRCYGTWLHGDKRGSVDRNNNIFRNPKLPHEPARKGYVQTQMKQEPVKLDARRRSSIRKAIRETCAKRGWTLVTINIRTNHVHLVVKIGLQKPEIALVAFKANAIRQMREDGLWDSARSPWVQKGSRRYLWTAESVSAAIEYVDNGQGDDLPFA